MTKKKVGFPKAHRRTISMLHENGTTTFWKPVVCKDELINRLIKQIVPQYANIWGYNPDTPLSKIRANLDRPGFVVYLGREQREKNALKFIEIIHQVEEILGIEHPSAPELPKVGEDRKSAPLVVRADSWWIRSPVSLSFYFVLLRIAPFMRMRESFDKMVARIRKRQHETKKDGFSKKIKEALYIEKSKKNGNWDGFLNKTLPCLNREGRSDWLLQTTGRGIVSYNQGFDIEYPMSYDELFNLRVTEKVKLLREKQGIAWE